MILTEDELQALAHGVRAMEGTGRDHVPVPIAVIKRIIEAMSARKGQTIGG